MERKVKKDMKKKGFTLVELLAVIAILAILVIIALPNVMNLFNRAKKNAFETEIKEIYKTAQQQWITESMNESKSLVFCNKTDGTPLEMSGRTELKYSIKFNKSGEVVEYKVTDDSYQYVFTGSAGNGLEIDNIGHGPTDGTKTEADGTDADNYIVQISKVSVSSKKLTANDLSCSTADTN